MDNVKYLDTHTLNFSDSQTQSFCEDGSMQVSIMTILETLREYEVGIPRDYYDRDGAYWGIVNFLKDEEQKDHVVEVMENNTSDLAGNVSVDFGFAQYDSLVSEDTLVLMHIHNGEPFLRESLSHNRYPAMLFRFPKGTSFYDVLNDITFENPSVPWMMIEAHDNHYLVLPRVVSESYFVRCLETDETLEPTDEVCFSGNEEDVRKQIEAVLQARAALGPNK